MTSPQFPQMLRKMWSGGEVQEWLNREVCLMETGFLVSGPKKAILVFNEEEAKQRESECADDPDDITWTTVYMWGKKNNKG